MKIMLKVLPCLFLLLAGPPVFSQEPEEEMVTGRELLAGCEENTGEGMPNQFCMQYVFGLVQTVLMLQQMEDTGQQLFCIDPQAVSLQKVTTDVTDWLHKQLDRLDEDAYVLVTEALNEQYPCNRA